MTTLTEMKHQSIFVKGVCLDVHIGWWKGWTKLEVEDINVKIEDIPKIFQLGRKRLLSTSAFSDFASLENFARSLILKNSYPFLRQDLKFVPYETLPEVISKLEEMEKAFDKFVEVFLLSYQLEKEKFLQEYSEYYDRLVDKYPTEAYLKNRFYFDWTMFEISIPDGVKDKIIDIEQAEHLQTEWDKSRAKLNDKMDYWIGDVGTKIREEIISTCEHMQALLEGGNTIKINTLDNCKENIKRMKAMNFLDDEQVGAALDELDNKLLTEIDRDIPAIVDAFSRTLSQVKAEMQNPDINLTRKFIL